MDTIDAEPLFADRRGCERAHMLLSFIAQSYVRGRLNDAPATVIVCKRSLMSVETAQIDCYAVDPGLYGLGNSADDDL